MEAKDTVMTYAQMIEKLGTAKDDWWNDLPETMNAEWKAQAEISFEAGKQDGRKEVVEFCKQKIFNTFIDRDTGEPYLAFRDNSDKAWQSQLKEWGMGD